LTSCCQPFEDGAAANRLFRKALSDPSHPQPRVINTDQARLYSSAIPGVKEEGILRRRCRLRPVREFQAARRTIEGYEAMHMIRKGQARVSRVTVRKQNQFIDKLFDLPA
jgi:transposase-like protein